MEIDRDRLEKMLDFLEILKIIVKKNKIFYGWVKRGVGWELLSRRIDLEKLVKM